MGLLLVLRELSCRILLGEGGGGEIREKEKLAFVQSSAREGFLMIDLTVI